MTEHEIEAMKRNIEAQLDEYERTIAAAAAWHRDWKARQPKGFRVKPIEKAGAG
jgi:hypothetical protein